MPSAIVPIIGVGASLLGARKQKKAQQAAANEQRQAQIQSANILAEAGQKAEAEILKQKAETEYTSKLSEIEAIKPLEAFSDIDTYNRAVDETISNLPVGGAIADSIRKASMDFVKSRPEFQSEFLQPEMKRQADLSVSAASPQFRDSLTAAGQQGLAAATDIARIKQGGQNRLADIAGGTASQRSSVLIGQTPTLTNLAQSANEARILGDVAGQNFKTNTIGSLANLGGQLFNKNTGLLRKDEFGFRAGEDPFQV